MTEKTTGADARGKLQAIFESVKRYRVVVTTPSGRQFLTLPLLVAIILTVLAPKLAILVVIVALLRRARIDVVAREKRKSHAGEDTHAEAA